MVNILIITYILVPFAIGSFKDRDPLVNCLLLILARLGSLRLVFGPIASPG